MGQTENNRRIGVVDVGSNSVRLVVFDSMSRSPAYFYNEKVLCGLGAGLSETGLLNPEGKKRALRALHRFIKLTNDMNVKTLTGVATAAVREANDGPAFVKQVTDELGLNLRVASGKQEAELSAKGILLSWPKADGLMCDIGGASMELASLEAGIIGRCDTSPLGPLKLMDVHAKPKKLEKVINKEVETLVSKVKGNTDRLFLVGGSWRAIGRLDMVRRGYPFAVLHAYRMTRGSLNKTIDWINDQEIEHLISYGETSSERMRLVPMASLVLRSLLKAIKPSKIYLSSYGLREGLLYEQMPPAMRSLDPLIVACTQMENSMARFPGFGRALYDWLLPLYGDATERQKRLILAACLLHDISWQAHPDYRAEMCFDSITRANLSGVNHEERLFLGLAILSRYKNAGLSKLELPISSLLDTEYIDVAIQLGKAMRLGAMLSGAQASLLDKTSLHINDNKLVLTLAGEAKELNGEVVEKRLASLAAKMERVPILNLEQ